MYIMLSMLGGCNIEGEDDAYDFGSGAGFYVDATTDKWKTNYRMYSYVTKELPALINANFPVQADKQSIMGHRLGKIMFYFFYWPKFSLYQHIPVQPYP